MYDPSSINDAICMDPAFLDPEFPPAIVPFHFESKGTRVFGDFYLAQGEGKKGLVIVSTQMFGGESLDSVIHPLMMSGIHVIKYHPRGMWDNKCEYSLWSAADDLNALIDFVRSCDEPGKKTPNGHTYRIDPDRIALFGLSGGGGNVSYAVCAERNDINYAIAVAPGNLEYQLTPEVLERSRPFFGIAKEMTGGRIDLEKSLAAMTPAESNRFNIIRLVPKLLSKHLMLIGASYDATSPVDVCHKPIARALKSAGAAHFTDVILESDHRLLTKRIALARLMISWLKSEGNF